MTECILQRPLNSEYRLTIAKMTMAKSQMSKSYKVAFVMDDIHQSNPHKDTSLYWANLCQTQGVQVYYVHSLQLFFEHQVMMVARQLTIDYHQPASFPIG